MFMIIALELIIIMRFSINCSTVICSPTIIYAISREPLVKPMSSGLFYILLNLVYILPVSDLLFCNLYFPIYKPKIPKIFTLLSLSDLTLRITVKGLTTPLSRWLQVGVCLCRYSVACCVISYWIDTLVLKTEGNTYAPLVHHPFLFKGKSAQAQEVARNISGAVAGEIYIKPRHTKYPS